MHIAVIGVSHKSAGVELREAFAKAAERRFGGELPVHGALSYVLLSTCNRTELYFSASNLSEAHSYLLSVFRQEIKRSFEHALYSFFGFECFFHLASVTSGVLSAIIGESEIQGQVKAAYEKNRRPLKKELHFLFQKSLKIGKKTRTCFPLCKTLPTFEETVANAATYLLGDLSKRSILLVGLSEINYKVLAHFKQKKYSNITLCNRTFSKAQAVGQKERLAVLPFEKLPTWSRFDLTIVGTKATNYLIGCNEGIQKRHQLVIDLSLPRNVNPKIKTHLLNVDDLKPSTPSKNRPFFARLQREMIAKEALKQIRAFKNKEKGPISLAC